jgi:nucleotide-binding universal stress UspA family protein
LNNLLVAVDLKPTDQALMQFASAIAEKFNSSIWVLHIAAPDPDFVGYDVGPSYIREMRADELRKEHRQLQTIADRLNKKGIKAEGLLIQGPTVDMILEEVAKLKIDLLIMGSHKHGFLYEAWMGHTSVKVIKEIPIPVLIIPLIQGA